MSRIPSAEATAFPWWAIVDPSHAWTDEADNASLHAVAHCITGVFFSREAAQQYLDAKSYSFSEQARVYCLSGHAARGWKEFCDGEAKAEARGDGPYPGAPVAKPGHAAVSWHRTEAIQPELDATVLGRWDTGAIMAWYHDGSRAYARKPDGELLAVTWPERWAVLP